MKNYKPGLIIIVPLAIAALTACDNEDSAMKKAGAKLDQAYEQGKQTMQAGMSELKEKTEDKTD